MIKNVLYKHRHLLHFTHLFLFRNFIFLFDPHPTVAFSFLSSKNIFNNIFFIVNLIQLYNLDSSCVDIHYRLLIFTQQFYRTRIYYSSSFLFSQTPSFYFIFYFFMYSTNPFPSIFIPAPPNKPSLQIFCN